VSSKLTIELKLKEGASPFREIDSCDDTFLVITVDPLTIWHKKMQANQQLGPFGVNRDGLNASIGHSHWLYAQHSASLWRGLVASLICGMQ